MEPTRVTSLTATAYASVTCGFTNDPATLTSTLQAASGQVDAIVLGDPACSAPTACGNPTF
ncbi:MAG: hypothetical protein ACPGUV_10925 [Polyangiales bacterium]